MSALLDAAKIAERLASDNLWGEAQRAVWLLAKHARESAALDTELDAWKRLAIARHPDSEGACDGMYAKRDLRALGIDPATGKRIEDQSTPEQQAMLDEQILAAERDALEASRA